ncbi:integrase [Streptomyces lavendulae]|uniref:integrase n=1 Tax=Streptomyces lavendulae TaxID=1914 RepID=UPI003695294D
MRARDTWSVHYTSRELPHLKELPWFLESAPCDPEPWLDDAGIPDGVPFLLSPRFEYDVELNAYWLTGELIEAPINSNANRARALAGFFTFLWCARGRKDWRDATEGDHLAYLHWRRRDRRGPQIDGGTWNTEVTHVNRFYVWAKGKRLLGSSPVPLRPRKPAPTGTVKVPWDAMAPATFAHNENGQHIEWLPARSYRWWRDVGIRGYGGDGLPTTRFRGRWASRNASYSDLMVRTGMRIEEQSCVLVTELPHHAGSSGGYRRFWLPGEIAKGGSARWVYVPYSGVLGLGEYVQVDRAEVVEEARARRRYNLIRRPIVIPDPARPLTAVKTGSFGRVPVDVRTLKPAERFRLLRDTDEGLEPAMFWLGESGAPLALSTWKDLFTTANARCEAQGVNLAAHAHLLRHTFAVLTLEQLQRGHLAALGEMNVEQRRHYVRIFGDPVDWVRRRLGHASLLTTVVYLHALEELEMETRMALVPDDWEDPRDTPLSVLGEERPPEGVAVPGTRG